MQTKTYFQEQLIAFKSHIWKKLVIQEIVFIEKGNI